MMRLTRLRFFYGVSVKRVSTISSMVFVFLLITFSQANAFQPSDITGLKMWLKADSLTANDGDPVSSWSDSSGNSNNADQSTASQKPIYKSSVSDFDGKPVIRFDGDDYLETVNNFTFGDFTICAIFKDDEEVGENGRILDHDFDDGFWIGRDDTHHDYWGGGVKEGNAPFGRFVKLEDDQPHCLCSVRASGTHTLYGDGFMITNGTVSSATTSTNPIAIGQRTDSGGSNLDQFFGGDIAEIVVFDNAISDADRLQLEEYFEERFRIPFKRLGRLAKLTPVQKEPKCNANREGSIIYYDPNDHLYVCDSNVWQQVQYSGNTLPVLHDGSTWTQATSSAAFSARANGEVLSYDGKLWIMGGQPSGVLNDVWSSTDGITWTQVTANAQWSARTQFASVVHDGKMWVLGGNQAPGYLNDVWYSTDGIAWTQATANAAWPARSTFDAVSFNNKMWVIAGAYASGGVTTPRSDVWSSTDGITWTQETASAAFPARWGNSALAFDNKLWVLGGYGSGNKNDVWSSTDGKTWTQVTASAAWSANRLAASVVYDAKMWLLGGTSNGSEVWSSSDGNTWSLANSNVGWGSRSSADAVVLDGLIWLVAGEDGSTKKNDVWHTTD